MANVKDILRDNLAAVEGRIAAACVRAGRRREEVNLVAVTKYVDAEVVRRLQELGVRLFGESRPQELWRKAAELPPAPQADVEWHLVGHLQRNKIERTLPIASLIHSVDSIRLLKALEGEAQTQARRVSVLLEFNLSDEPNKHGFKRDDLDELLKHWNPSSDVQVCGLMTMAALSADPQEARPVFATLRFLREEMQRRLAPGEQFHHLSMGMTNDFEVAIEEGATLVRIGSALFEGLESGSHD